MAVSLRAAGTGATGTTTLTVTVPASAQAGDLLVMAVNACPSTTPLCSATATGWNPQGTTVQDTGSSAPYPNLSILTRACQAGDPGAGVDITFSGNTPATCAGVIDAYSGADTSATPFEAFSTYVNTSDDGQNHVLTAITTTAPEWVIAAGASRGTNSETFSMAAPYQVRCNVEYGTGADAKLGVFDSNGTVAAGTVQPTIVTVQFTSQFVGWLGAVKVASAAPFTATPGPADAAGSAGDAAAQAGATTAALYAGSATAVSGSWQDTGNATGSTQGTYATWTDSAAGSSAALELTAFGADSAVPAGSTVQSVTCMVRHGETPASAIASVTAQAYSGATPVGSPQPLTVADAVHEDTVTFTGLAYADLADLRVRVAVTRN